MVSQNLNEYEDTTEEAPLEVNPSSAYSKTMSNFHKPLLNKSNSSGKDKGAGSDDQDSNSDKGKIAFLTV